MSLKGKLMKTRKGIPALALILIIVLSATAIGAGYLVYEDTEKAGIKESITIDKKQGFQGEFNPGQKIGDDNGCAKYMIANEGPVELPITVDIVESESNIDELTEWYGINVVPSQDSWDSTSETNYDSGVVSEEGEEHHTCTFDIGTATYETGSENTPENDSNHWRVFIDGKLKPDVDPDNLKVTVEIFRG